MTNMTCSFGMNQSWIGTIIKSKNKMVEHGKSSVSVHDNRQEDRKRHGRDEMLSAMWIEYQHQLCGPLSLMLIQRKAKSLFYDLQQKTGESTAEDMFVARNGWFLRFKAHMNLHNMKVRGKVVSADEDAANKFLETLNYQ